MRPLIAVPAAGGSRRMRGRDKLLETVEGEPLLRRQVKAALATGCPVLVLLPPHDTAREASLHGLEAERRTVPDAVEGMSGSLRVAARAAETRALGILLPDVPGVTADDILTVLRAFERTRRPTRASDPEGRPGTPLFLPPELVSLLENVTGDEGGKAILEDNPPTLVRFPDDRATRDLDTPEAWAAWRADTGKEH